MWRTAVLLALRGMARRPYFALVSLAGVAFTLGTLALGSAVLEHVFAPAPPLSNAGRIVGILGQRLTGPEAQRTGFAGWSMLRHAVSDLAHAEDVGVFRHARRIDVWVGESRDKVWLKSADAGYWRVLDFSFLEGGPWSAGDDDSGRRVAVLSQRVARQLFGSSPATGKHLDIDGRSFEVVGVVRPVPITQQLAFGELFVPLSSSRSDSWKEESSDALSALLLAKSPADRDALKAEIATRVAAITPPAPFETVELFADTPFEFVSRPIFGPDQAYPERLIAVLVLAALGFMLLPALNLVTVAMSRGLERSTEIGIRRAFGATRAAIAAQLLMETLVMTAVGALMALALLRGLFLVVEVMGWLPGARLAIGPRTWLATGVMTVVFAVLSGGLPAWRLARLHPVDAIGGRISR